MGLDKKIARRHYNQLAHYNNVERVVKLLEHTLGRDVIKDLSENGINSTHYSNDKNRCIELCTFEDIQLFNDVDHEMNHQDISRRFFSNINRVRNEDGMTWLVLDRQCEDVDQTIKKDFGAILEHLERLDLTETKKIVQLTLSEYNDFGETRLERIARVIERIMGRDLMDEIAQGQRQLERISLHNILFSDDFLPAFIEDLSEKFITEYVQVDKQTLNLMFCSPYVARSTMVELLKHLPPQAKPLAATHTQAAPKAVKKAAKNEALFHDVTQLLSERFAPFPMDKLLDAMDVVENKIALADAVATVLKVSKENIFDQKTKSFNRNVISLKIQDFERGPDRFLETLRQRMGASFPQELAKSVRKEGMAAYIAFESNPVADVERTIITPLRSEGFQPDDRYDYVPAANRLEETLLGARSEPNLQYKQLLPLIEAFEEAVKTVRRLPDKQNPLIPLHQAAETLYAVLDQDRQLLDKKIRNSEQTHSGGANELGQEPYEARAWLEKIISMLTPEAIQQEVDAFRANNKSTLGTNSLS